MRICIIALINLENARSSQISLHHVQYGFVKNSSFGKANLNSDDITEVESFIKGLLVVYAGNKQSIEYAVETKVKHNNVRGAMELVTKHIIDEANDRGVKCTVNPMLIYQYGGERREVK